MKAISYLPSKDKMIVRFRSARGKPTKEFGRFKLWWDKQGICAVAIMPFLEELEEFEKSRNWVQLGGIWRGVNITEEDIKEARRELLEKLEKRWEK
jgi:hypothetical protein